MSLSFAVASVLTGFWPQGAAARCTARSEIVSEAGKGACLSATSINVLTAGRPLVWRGAPIDRPSSGDRPELFDAAPRMQTYQS